jgi:hypothetical protein
VRQPIGQQQIQTGPNRWESHPVYDPPLAPYQPTPVYSPLLDGTPFSAPPAVLPAAEAIPPPPPPVAAPVTPRRGPREY